MENKKKITQTIDDNVKFVFWKQNNKKKFKVNRRTTEDLLINNNKKL